MATVTGRVLRCNGLPHEHLFGRSDPYVVVKAIDSEGKEVGESRTPAKKGSDVEWAGDEAVFNFADVHFDGALEFRVWDKDLGPDDVLGQVVVPIKLICFEETELTLSLGINRKLNAAGKKTPNGTITISMKIDAHHHWL
mmetsp:Transcript_7603/g.16347  ORF Transcript_7603/g.16347 Transcript_7603/m.16347 type:complete len:140 (+) Transcript_7603:72-491(+)|eukprot:CAMPEP_0204269918 /NCGR_PEP_ID=MMETSP0468-20130131/17630_1 /ASSEMBLY_ACC=CAM_ASM_000383 /TAXON_ID=2969 /ORGANISM="Oxyrrhis marina" /LENGTH=139 /DNA_ID=CAMNT_0051245381 /DNA_START=52 /DNA_END=471 /DNA_ORIENTATION=+